MNQFFIIIFIFIILFIDAVVLLSANTNEYSNLLINLSRENGLFESGTFLLLFVSGIYLIFKQKNFSDKYMRAFIIALSLISFVAALEEISWTQHWFNYESFSYFKEHNMQQETNLHNFIPSVFFSTIIYTFIYVAFIFIPLLNILKKNLKIFQNNYIQIIMPNFSMVLIALFAMSLQVYHVQEYITDVIFTLSSALFTIFIYFKTYKQRSRLEFILLLSIIVSIIIFIINNNIFYITNRQYEIREFSLVFLYLMWIYSIVNSHQAKI